jgi:diaminobutyrate-2-oxoglutarate transaminase
MQGIIMHVPGAAEEVCHEAFQRGLIMETSGPDDEVAKLLPPLTLDEAGLEKGLSILEDSVAAVAKRHTGQKRDVA